ncbi:MULTISPECIES: hypothetical protein [Legionella]|uniref:Uncharacterized protein n=1 Tax=Legionella maceachernii TaxID=466 RepID=Q49J70_9GAMM|nr:hypothetical protein [Legionella maceachernii]AAX56206.1 unknown [Legionella maceachernii]KTD24573.1 hypothetical protein Lmac_2660 [Legionella maceachernii]SJZ62982.1 hypothetical protein SAMN02745128_00651 [Legionella maceachernii]SUP01011.1 Uncharacterised protein [Legionella maceachernii]
MLRNPYTHFKPTTNAKSTASDLLSSSSLTSEDFSGVPRTDGMETFRSLQTLKGQVEKMIAICKSKISANDEVKKPSANEIAGIALGKAVEKTGHSLNNEFPKETKKAQAESDKDSSLDDTITPSMF